MAPFGILPLHPWTFLVVSAVYVCVLFDGDVNVDWKLLERRKKKEEEGEEEEADVTMPLLRSTRLSLLMIYVLRMGFLLR